MRAAFRVEGRRKCNELRRHLRDEAADLYTNMHSKTQSGNRIGIYTIVTRSWGEIRRISFANEVVH